MSNAKRDGNFVPTLIGVSSSDLTTPTLVAVDPITHRVLTDSASGIAALFSQTNTVTVSNSTAETNLDSTGTGSKTLIAGFFQAGVTLKIDARGIHSAAANPTIRLRFKLGSTTLLDTTAVTSGNGTNDSFHFSGLLTCYTAGATGTVWAQGEYIEAGAGANIFSAANTSVTTIDTTSAQTMALTVQWGTASNSDSITCTNLLISSS